MAVLYLTEPGTRLHKADGRLMVRKGDDVLEEIPLIHVEQVVLVGRGVGLTTAALHALVRRGVEVVFLSARGQYLSRITGREHGHSRLRYAQALAVGRAEFALPVAQSVVYAKVHNQRILLLRHGKGDRRVRRLTQDLAEMLPRIRRAASLDALRGLEGGCARLYFRGLRLLIRPPADGPSWGFEQRAYHPPPDPVNALLSFAYTLLLKEMVAACQMTGLDPALGFFHVLEYARPSLALDLMEPFRPLVGDSVVLYALNRPVVRLADFREHRPSPAGEPDSPSPQGEHPPSGAAIYLREAPRRRFLALYEERMLETAAYPQTGERSAYRRILRLQAEALAHCILEDTPAFDAFMVR